jgi:hypothetical protein
MMSTALTWDGGDSGPAQVCPSGTHQLIGTNGIGAPMHQVTGPTTPIGGGGGGGGAPMQLLLPASHV